MSHKSTNQYLALERDFYRTQLVDIRHANCVGCFSQADIERNLDAELADVMPKHLANRGAVCPFCGEDDFDLIGLKNHFLKHCDAYQNCTSVEKERAAPRDRSPRPPEAADQSNTWECQHGDSNSQNCTYPECLCETRKNVPTHSKD